MDRVTAPSQIGHMAARRPNTQFVPLHDGHVIHQQDRAALPATCGSSCRTCHRLYAVEPAIMTTLACRLSEIDAKLIRAAA